jgi:hypothetical protein
MSVLDGSTAMFSGGIDFLRRHPVGVASGR